MCISQSPASLIRMNVTKTKRGSIYGHLRREGERGSFCPPLHAAVKFHINSTLKIMEPERINNFTDIKCCAKRAGGTAAMTLIWSSHRAISSVVVRCCWRVRWSQSQSGRSRKREEKQQPRCTTPHPPLLPPTPPLPPCCDVTYHVRWWSTLIPGWESAEGESGPESHFFNPGRPLPPCSGR